MRLYIAQFPDFLTINGTSIIMEHTDAQTTWQCLRRRQFMIDNRYINKTQTPLRYYHFLRIVLVFVIIAQAVDATHLFTSSTSLYTLIFAACRILLTALAAFGLNTMKWYGFLSLVGMFGLTALDGVVAIVIICTNHLTSPSIATAASQILGCIIAAIPTWMYFSKRRLLFAPLPKEYTVSHDGTIVKNFSFTGNATSSDTPTIPKVQFCRKCGARLLDDSIFCSHCGATVEKLR